MATSELPPAGWYPDPKDSALQRWWDGTTWAASPPPPQLAPDPSPQMPEPTAVIADATSLVEVFDEALAWPQQARGAGVEAVRDFRFELVQQRLEDMPVEQLREVTGGRLRLRPLTDRGVHTLADLTGVSAHQLIGVPGIGQSSAPQIVAAHRRIADAVLADTPVRFDPQQPSRRATEALRCMARFQQTDDSLGRSAGTLTSRRHALARGIEAARPATSKVRMLLSGRRKKAAARAAVAGLAAQCRSPELSALRHDASNGIQTAEAVAAWSQERVWTYYRSNSGSLYALVEALGGGAVAAAGTHGHLTDEIVARVNAIELDERYLKVTLRGYQSFAARYALAQRRVLIGDEMGLGKTIEALAAITHLAATGKTHFLVVCPASVLANWAHEIADRTQLTSTRLHGADRDRSLARWATDGGVAVTTFGTLRSLQIPVAPSMLVVDEAHYVKNPEAQRSRAVRHCTSTADHVIFMTGTPMENRLSEFHNLVSVLQPDVAARLASSAAVIGPTAFREAAAAVYLRRNQDDVLNELPERLEMTDWVDLSDDDLDRYRAAVVAGDFAGMRRAAMLSPVPARSSKLSRLTEIIDESEANGWKVVVFTYFRDVLTNLENCITSPLYGPIHGGVAATQRQQIVDEFTRHDGHAVLISQIEAGGVGLNIQAASVVVLAEPQWKPSTEDQAIARCHRMGQTERVHVHRLLAEGTVDEHLLALTAHKRAEFDHYARPSAMKDATADAVDISEAEAARQIIEAERDRLISHEAHP